MNHFDINELERIAKRFEPLPINGRFPRFFCDLSQWLQPRAVLEIGTYQGTVVTHLVYRKGQSTPRRAEVNSGQYFLSDADSAYKQIADTLGKHKLKIDILIINNSWHCYEYVKMHYEACGSLLNSPALIICDGISPASSTQGMMRFWDEMPEPKFLNANLHLGAQVGFVKI